MADTSSQLVLDERGRERLKELLAEAVDLPAAERAAYFEAKAGGDDLLCERLRQLADAWDRATTILNTGGSGSGFTPPDDSGRDLIGAQIGPYLVDEVIGSGGFGFVYRAHQEAPVRREVALKVLRPGVGGRELLSRFDIERQALARLSHPSIARIYDAGALPDGRPFFAMELVEGEPITQYCDGRRLDLEARVRLFVEVCRAVQHAHNKGVIHRDIKPSNILVAESDGRPLVKVIDFGIAKATDEPLTDLSVVTVARQMMGTPRYMSPEQASLDAGSVDTRSDVYSLGVVLYELLCGTTPVTDETLRKAGLRSLHRVLSEGRFQRPSQRIAQSGSDPEIGLQRGTTTERLRSKLAGELDWIAMRAIEPDPDRRYPTAFAFSRDLERHLDDEPIDARPPSGLYLSAKFARRHRAAVGIAGVALLALIVVLATVIQGLLIVRGERNLALEAQANEALARADAEDVLEYFLEVFSAPQGDRLGHDVTVLEAVKASAGEIDRRFADRPHVAAFVHNTAGNMFRVLGENELAGAHLSRAVDLMRGLEERELGVELQFVNDHAILFDDLGDAERFESMLTEARAQAVEHLGVDHAATLAISANLAGNVWISQERYDEAIAELERVLAAPALEHETRMVAMVAMGSALSRSDRADEAASIYQTIIAEADPRRDLRHILAARNNLAGILFSKREVESALEQYLAVESVLASEFGEKSQRHLPALNNIAVAQEELGRYGDASATRDRVEALAAEILPEGHPAHARLLEGRASLLAKQERYEESERAFLEVRRLFESTPGIPDSWLRSNASDLGKLYRKMDRPEEAARWEALVEGGP